MPKITQEFFLIGSLPLTQPYNFPKPHNDISGEKSNMVYTLIRKEFVVKNDSNLWHHLNVKNCDALERNGSWVKTTLKVWEKAISKESIKLRIESSHDVNSARGVVGHYSKDHFEVFFDEKI